jgi:hypothetical protein
MASLPYITSSGNIDKALNGIKSAAVPPRVTQDFVKTILKIPGGSGTQMTTYLKKIGFTAPNGEPLISIGSSGIRPRRGRQSRPLPLRRFKCRSATRA